MHLHARIYRWPTARARCLGSGCCVVNVLCRESLLDTWCCVVNPFSIPPSCVCEAVLVELSVRGFEGEPLTTRDRADRPQRMGVSLLTASPLDRFR